jgi:hypothetical protein
MARRAGIKFQNGGIAGQKGVEETRARALIARRVADDDCRGVSGRPGRRRREQARDFSAGFVIRPSVADPERFDLLACYGALGHGPRLQGAASEHRCEAKASANCVDH